MGRSDRLRAGSLWQTLCAYFSRLPSRYRTPALDPSLLRQVRALLGLLAGFLLVALAHERSARAGARRFHEEHLLPGEAWSAILVARGFKPLILHRSAPGDGKVRISHDARIIEFPGGIPGLPTGVHVRGVPDPKPDWIELSPGIEGFESWIRNLDAHPLPAPRVPGLKVNSIDPKEFRY